MSATTYLSILLAGVTGALFASLAFDGHFDASTLGWFFVTVFSLYVAEIATGKMKQSNG